MKKKKPSKIEQMQELVRLSDKEWADKLHAEIATYFFALEQFDIATCKGVRNLFIGVVLTLLASGLSMLGLLDLLFVIILSSMSIGYAIALLCVLDYSGKLLKRATWIRRATYTCRLRRQVGARLRDCPGIRKGRL